MVRHYNKLTLDRRNSNTPRKVSNLYRMRENNIKRVIIVRYSDDWSNLVDSIRFDTEKDGIVCWFGVQRSHLGSMLQTGKKGRRNGGMTTPVYCLMNLIKTKDIIHAGLRIAMTRDRKDGKGYKTRYASRQDKTARQNKAKVWEHKKERTPQKLQPPIQNAG